MEANEENLAHVAELYKKAVMAGLDGVEFLAEFEDGVLAREYNGIGPEWAGHRIRDWITGKFGVFEPAALIHDMRNYMSDGTRAAFMAANEEFLRNCLKLVNYSFPWYRLRRYTMRGVAMGMYDFVSGPGGWAAWHDCHERNLNHKTSDGGHQTSKSGV